MERALKIALSRMPKRPLHLRAELIWAEHDGVGVTVSTVRLHTELDASTLTFTVTSYVPDGGAKDNIILITSDCESSEAKRLSECGYAVFALRADDIVSVGESVKTGYEKAFIRGRAARKAKKAVILTWAALRVAEYVRTLHGLSEDIIVCDTVTDGVAASITECCDTSVRVMHPDEYAAFVNV